jgi:hypothetical protein
LGDPPLDVVELPPGFGVPGNIIDPNCCCGGGVYDETGGRVALLTLGGDVLVFDIGGAEPKRPARSSTTGTGPLLEGALSSKSMSDKSFLADEPPSSAGMGFDENE